MFAHCYCSCLVWGAHPEALRNYSWLRSQEPHLVGVGLESKPGEQHVRQVHYH